MRHVKDGKTLGRPVGHKKAMLRNIALSILTHERIVTTQTKAKEARKLVERLITYGKKNTLHTRRLAARWISHNEVVKKLFEDIAPSYKDREGGYTRILKLKDRRGDNAPSVIFELVGRRGEEPRKKKNNRKSSVKKTASRTAAKSPVQTNTDTSTPKDHSETQQQDATPQDAVAPNVQTDQEATAVQSAEAPDTQAAAEKTPDSAPGPDAPAEKNEDTAAEQENNENTAGSDKESAGETKENE
jgi:large subunit ribosomal protein L17